MTHPITKINKFPTNLGNDLVILKVGHNIIDVFYGNDGWEPHARFQIKSSPRGKYLSPINGAHLPVQIYKTVIERIN